MNTAQTTTSAVITSTLEKFQTMTMRAHSLKIVNSTILLGLEADRTLPKLTPEDLLEPMIIANYLYHDYFVFFIDHTTTTSSLL